MSAKDAFLKKVQENKSNQEDLRSIVQAHRTSFRSAMFDLTKQVDHWLHGSGVEVITAERNFHDETIITLNGCEDLSSYSVAVCTMSNGTKTATIEPLGIHLRKGTKGWASLIIDAPNRAPRTQRFIMRLIDDGTWTIRNDDVPSTIHEPLIKPETPLTEESFFQTISSLA